MANHYYTENPELAHDLESWSFPLRGRTFQFTTDSGVFSRGTVDYGSRVLIDAFEWENLPAGRLLDVGCGYGPIGLSSSGDWSTGGNGGCQPTGSWASSNERPT